MRLAALLLVGLALFVVVSWVDTSRRPDSLPLAVPREGLEAPVAARPLLQGAAVRRPAPASAPERGSWTVHGRAVDPDGRAISGAEAEVHWPGLPPLTTTSDVQGRFALVLPSRGWPRFGRSALLLHASGARCAVAPLWYVPSQSLDRDLGRIVLRAGAPLRVHVDAGGSPAQGAQVHVWSVRIDEGNRRYAWYVGQSFTQATGEADLGILPEGSVRLAASMPHWARRASIVDLPSAQPVRLVLTTPVDLRVKVVSGDASDPVAGAHVTPWESLETSVLDYLPLQVQPEPTGPDGWTTVSGLDPEDDLHLEVAAAGHPLLRGWTPRVVGGAGEVTLVLDPTSTRRWRIQEGALAMPAEGTPLRIVAADSVWHEPLSMSTGRVEGGAVVVPHWPRVQDWTWAYAVAPDGSVAKLIATSPDHVWEPVTFVPGRSLAVRLRERDGRPAVGYQVSVSRQGSPSITLHCDPISTDSHGLARFTGIYGEKEMDVSVSRWDMNPSTLSLGRIDLAAGDVELERYLEPERLVRVGVLIEGHPRLPDEYSLTDLWGRAEDVSAVEEVPFAAELRIRQRHDRAELGLSIPGYVSVPAPDDPFPWGESVEKDEIRVVKAFVRPARLVIRLSGAPPDEETYGVMLQRQEAPTCPWEEWTAGRPTLEPDGRLVLDGLEPGRVRLVVRTHGAIVGEFQLRAGETTDVGAVDVSSSQVVRGRVLVPEGLDTWGVRIHVDGVLRCSDRRWDSDREGPDFPVDRDGSFELRLPPGEKHVLTARHPFCRPHEPVIVPAATECPLIELQALPRVSLKVLPRSDTQPWYDPPMSSSWDLPYPVWHPEDCVEVILTPQRQGAERRPAFTFEPSFFWDAGQGQDLVMAAEPGRYRAWISVPSLAPFVLEEVEFRDGTLDLGPRTLSPGTTLTIRVQPEPDARLSSLDTQVTAASGPPYERRPAKREYEDLSPLVVPGLGRGSFDVVVDGYCQGSEDGRRPGVRWERRRTLSVDGSNPAELVLRVAQDGSDPESRQETK